MIYISIIFFYICGLLSIDKRYHNRYSLLWAIAAVALLPIFVGINGQRADFGGYLQFFYDSPQITSQNFFKYSMQQHTEIGYNYFQSIIKTLFNSATFYFIIFCFFSLLIRYRFYKEFVPKADILLCYIAFFSHEFLRKDCVQIRNGFASAIVLLALVFLYNNQRIKFILSVLFASLFQTVALVALPLVIARTRCTIRYSKFLKFLFFISIFITLAFPIKNLMYSLEDIGFLPSAVINYLYWGEYSKSMSILNPQLIKQIIITIFFIANLYRYKDDRPVFFLIQIYLVSTVYYLVFRDFEILAGRFGSLFYGVEPPLLILAINKSMSNIQLKKIFFILFYFSFLTLNILTYSSLGFSIEIH